VPLLTPKDEDSDPYEAKSAKAVKPAQVIWRLLESLMEKHDGELWTGDPDLDGILDVVEVSEITGSADKLGSRYRYTSSRLSRIYNLAHLASLACSAAYPPCSRSFTGSVLFGRRSG